MTAEGGNHLSTPGSARDATRPARPPVGLLGFLVLVGCVEAYLARRDVDFTTFSATDWRMTSIAAGRSKTADVLVFGDSLLKFGISPRVLERRLGGRAFNLSLLGGQGVSSCFLLRRAIEAGARPRAILVDCQDPPIPVGGGGRGIGLREHLRDWPEAFGLGELYEMARSALNASLFASVALGRLVPSIKAREEIRANLVDALVERPSGTRGRARVQRRNFEANAGALMMSPAKGPTPSPAAGAVGVATRSYRTDPVSDEYLDKFLRLAEDHGVRVFWVLPPTSPEHRAYREASGERDYHDRQASALRARFPGLVVVDARGSGYPRRAFIDDVHLDAKGAATFSADLADVVARHLDGPPVGTGWASLPPYRERRGGTTLEDWDGSRTALSEIRRGRR